MGTQGRGRRGPIDLGAQQIAVKHNVEMAHRLSQTPGKCENIHGHSWNVILYVGGEVDRTGKVLEFGELKAWWRGILDREFDHRLLLWEKDPLIWNEEVSAHRPSSKLLPGLTKFEFDPTTENFAYYLQDLCVRHPLWELYAFKVEVWETAVNMASYP